MNHITALVGEKQSKVNFDFFWRIYIRRIDTYEFSTSIRKAD